MIRVRIEGFKYGTTEEWIRTRHKASGKVGVVKNCYLRPAKIEEMKEYGFAYTNLPGKEFIQ